MIQTPISELGGEYHTTSLAKELNSGELQSEIYIRSLEVPFSRNSSN